MRWYALVFAALLRSVSARADVAEVSLDCNPLGDELRAQVEARLRATLLVDGVNAVRIALTCPEFVATAQVERDDRVVQRRIASNPRALADALLVAADQALLEAANSAPASEAPKAAAAALPKSATKRAAASPPARRYSDEGQNTASATRRREAAPPLRFRADGLLEHWTQQWAAGGSAALEDGTRTYRYGFTVGALLPTSSTPGFDATEVFGVISFGLGGPELGGFQALTSAGVSGLFAQPNHGVAGGSTDSIAIVLGFDVAYPIWFGRVALTPGVGGRAFTAGRSVSVDSTTELELAGFVPHVSLGLTFRTDE